MADYILNSSWRDIDAVAAAHKSNAFIEKRNLYNPTERDILPVSAKSDGSLWARSAMVYSFGSMREYDAFVEESPETLKNGDHVWIKSMGLNRANVYALYLYFQNGLNKTVEIVSGVTTGNGEASQFVVNIYSNAGGGLTCDKTAEQIYEAYNEGKTIVAKDSRGGHFHLYRATNSFVSFTAVGEYESDDEIFLKAYIVFSDGSVRELYK